MHISIIFIVVARVRMNPRNLYPNLGWKSGFEMWASISVAILTVWIWPLNATDIAFYCVALVIRLPLMLGEGQPIFENDISMNSPHFFSKILNYIMETGSFAFFD